MDELTDQKHHDKMREGFNMVLDQTDKIKSQNAWVIDHLEPTYSNSRNIHAMCAELLEEFKRLNLKISILEAQVDKLVKKSS